MTEGQKSALLELDRLATVDNFAFELVDEPQVDGNFLKVTIDLGIGNIETKEGGLDLREREEFVLWIPADFPFKKPSIEVLHCRFAGFPHVVWNRWLCLYQSEIEWNPSDGLYGIFDRLILWFSKAAINEMDPVEGPLEPPHHVTDVSQNPILIRANSPCESGTNWVGVAILKKYSNFTELVGWHDLAGEWPSGEQLALAFFLPNPLPMEFPKKGGELFDAIDRAGMDRSAIVKNLALAAMFSPEGEALHLVLGLPMRRASDGSSRNHIAVWTMGPEDTKSLKNVLSRESDTNEIRNLRNELRGNIEELLQSISIAWCKVFEDRPEIVVRRDKETPISWLANKKILILGCGALGSWAAEIIARAKPQEIHLVDNTIVKPGILVRQNFERQDIGGNKADALARRIESISTECKVFSYPKEAYMFIADRKNKFQDFDLVLDCTASNTFKMILERDWNNWAGRTPPMVSLIIDSQAEYCLCTKIPKDSSAGIWDAFLSLKHVLCMDGGSPDLLGRFYSEHATNRLFQPEPGCSDPTFVGSMADVISLVSEALNAVSVNCALGQSRFGLRISATKSKGGVYDRDLIKLPKFQDIEVGRNRVRIEKSVFTKARGWVRRNKRQTSSNHETGGLLWGTWDDSLQTIWIFDLSGPPSDSRHDPSHFTCGVDGTEEEHEKRMTRTYGTSVFIGYWHTHPNLPSKQSGEDISTMATLVSSIFQNRKKSIMLIFGRTGEVPTAGLYVYECGQRKDQKELITVEESQFSLEDVVV